MFCLLLLGLLTSRSSVGAEECSRFSVVWPQSAVPGQGTAVLVYVGSQQPVNVTLQLLTESREVLAQTTVRISGEGTVPISVPNQASGVLSLQTKLGCNSELCPTRAASQLQLVGAVRDVIIRPKSYYYKPGETIEFWVLALDHDLRLASEVTGSIYLVDPSGTKVALWEEVALDEGVKNFNVDLSEDARTGLWILEVSVGPSLFTASLNVSLARGSRDPALPELPIAEEHFVELGFSREMRRRYKPALPFVGKVEAVSSEKAVRVRVKVLDNITSIYSQDIEMSGGEGSFLVPAILSDSQVITLQAELVSVGGKEIDSHYVLAREPVYKWNSTSSCYLLVEGLQESLQPGDEAKAVVLSSCPCDRDLHYIVTTESHVTYWNEQRIPAYSLPPQDTLNGIPPLCRFNFTFTVEAVMAPVSHLLVYYVTDLGEPITDVISFDVKLFQRQVSVNLEQKKFWYPGETMDVQILSDLGSLVCLIGGRGADLHSQKINGGVEVELSEAGVGYIWDDCSGSQIVRSATPAPHHSVMADPSLEQLWLWHCFNYTSDIEAGGLRVNSPPEPGKWTMSVLSVSQAMGLRFSYPLSLTVFQPIDVEFRLPRAFRVGESLEVDIKIGNNLNTCVDVNALLTLSEGAHFLGGSQPFVAEKLRLGPHGATSLVVRVVATTPRYKNMTVEVSAYHSETCQSVTTEASLNHSLVGTVTKVQSILVNPEGLVKTHIESAYFCANEQMVISTAEEFRYEFISAPRNREGIVLEVRAGSGVHIGLSEVQDTSLRMYQIVIGDLDNSVSWIGRGKHGYSVHLLTSTSPGILSSEESRTFWLSWEHGVVAFGRGPASHQNTLLKWRMEKKMKVNFLGFASTWGKSAEIRIWNYNDEAGFSQVLHLDIPHSVLPGSEIGTLLVAGGLSLPSLKTSQRPSLAEFSSLATTISAIAPLIADERLKLHLNQTKNSDRQKLIKNLGTNIQKLLLFKKSDHSFSDHHNMTSFWSSVEVLDLVSRVQSVMGVDPELVVNLKRWIRSHQQRDGSFRAHYMDMALDNSSYSELARTVATTADTLVALLSIGIENQKDSEAVSLAKKYLEAHIISPLDGCTLAMLCHALVSVKSDHSAEALDRLKKASTNEEGEFGWPHPRDNSDWLYEEGTEQKKPSVATQLKEFKASLYTLMTYTQLGDLKAAEPVARYLFYRANILETHTELILTAVKAFSQFGLLALDPNRWLTVSLATSGMELTDTLELRASSSPPQLLNLPSLPTKVFVYATGAGCATVQGRISYATYTSSKTNHLFDLWAGVTEEIMPRRNSIQELEGKLPLLNIKTCFKWKGSEISGVIRLEVHLFSGFELISVRPNPLDVDYGARGDRVWFVVSNVSSLCAVCIEFSAKSDFIIGRLRPAFVRVYPSGRADLAAELFFHTRRGSPLLAETSDDDLITWFGTARAGDSDSMSSDFSDICPCGERCLSEVTTESPSNPTTQQKTGEDTSHGGEELSDFTDIIVFSDLHENLSTTEGELRTIEDITKELGFNTTIGGFTIEHNPDSNINLGFMSTSRSLVTTEISTIETENKTNIEKKLKKTKIVKTKINDEKTLNTKSLDKRKKFQRTKHTDIKTASEIIFSTLAPVLKHVHLNATGVKLDPQPEHIIISNITDNPLTIPIPVTEVLNITVGTKYVNRELKETISKPENEEDKVKPTKLNVVLSAEVAKVNSEAFLEHEEHSPLEILREGHTEMYQQQPAPGG